MDLDHKDLLEHLDLLEPPDQLDSQAHLEDLAQWEQLACQGPLVPVVHLDKLVSLDQWEQLDPEVRNSHRNIILINVPCYQHLRSLQYTYAFPKETSDFVRISGADKYWQ